VLAAMISAFIKPFRMICIQNSSVMQDLLSKIVFPLIVGITTYLLLRKLDDWKKRKSQSKLGAANLSALIKEVQTGIGIIKDSQIPTITASNPLPVKSWNGMSTISDDTLLRILEVSDNVQVKGFSPNDIRIHCKNYFDHMASNWENAITNANWRVNTQNLIVNGKYIDAATGVLEMLKQSRDLLIENSKKYFPK
jgi:hypothetical protein